MPRKHKCSYCGRQGHMIKHCNSVDGCVLFNNICSKAIEFITRENQSIHQRTDEFYNFLFHGLQVDELKILLKNILRYIYGTKKELVTRFINAYFIREYVMNGPYSILMSDNERRHIHIYANYWRLLSEGAPLYESEEVLSEYLDLTDPNNTIHSIYKFPINVAMKPVDLTEEEPTQSFECAICIEEQCPILDQVELGCGHSFCVTCISTMLTNSQKNKRHPCCGLCRAAFTHTTVHRQNIMEDYNTRFCYQQTEKISS